MLSIECYNGLPVEYESFLKDKYDSFITTCRYIEINHPAHVINYMLVYENNNLTDLLVFGNNGNTSICFNSLTNIDQNIIYECSKKIFDKYSSISKIKIEASYKLYDLKKSFLFSESDNHILALPPSMEEYYMNLGSSTRQNIRNRKVKLLRDYQQVNFVIKFGKEIEEGIIDKIVQLNIERMKYKGKIPGLDDKDKNDIYKYSKHYGCVAYLEIDGVIVAGSINTIINKEIFGHVIAHDNKFSKYNVGELCAFFLIERSIELGLERLHFLWGKSDFKKRLLAKPHLLFSYFIYRSYSYNYIFNKILSILSRIIIRIKYSKYSQPIRNAVKLYRKKSL